MSDHRFDILTAFCERCGVGIAEQLDNPRPCHEGENVLSIKPKMAKHRLGQIVLPLLGRID